LKSLGRKSNILPQSLEIFEEEKHHRMAWLSVEEIPAADTSLRQGIKSK
jgi:hypothetical protein